MSASRRHCRARRASCCAFLLLVIASAAGCSVVGPPSIHVPGRTVEPEMGRVPMGAAPRPPSASPSPLTERRVCRGAARPSGWIAVAYVAAPGECPLAGGADSSANAAILVRYSGRPLGMELDVCADQRVPRGWTGGRPEPDEARRCPGAGRGAESAVRRIRRVQ